MQGEETMGQRCFSAAFRAGFLCGAEDMYVQYLCMHAFKETDTLFGLLSYARRYWRKSLARQSATDAAYPILAFA